MKLGFSLKKSKKKPLLTAAAGDKAGGAFEGAAPASSEPEKVFVTDFDPSAPDVSADGKKALVIPLIAANEWRKTAEGEDPGADGLPVDTVVRLGEQGASTGSYSAGNPSEGGGNGSVTADEAAAEALLAEARGGQATGSASSSSSTLVIPLNGANADTSASNEQSGREEVTERAKNKAALFQDAAQRHRKANDKPILQQNAVPGLDKLADVKEKYRHDMSLRPDELDVHSEAYEAVPIEEFGAAMLRGMGWKGSVDKDEDADAAAPKPRHKLLGLGATMRPPLAGDKGKRKKKHHIKPKKDEPPSPPPPSSQRRAGMNLADDDKDKGRRSDSRERQTRDDSRSRSDRDSQKRRRRNGDDREEPRRSASRRDRSRSHDRRDSRDRRDDDRKSDDRRRRKRSRSGDRNRDRHRSSRR